MIIMSVFLFWCSKNKEDDLMYTIKDNIVYAYNTPTTMDTETFVSLGNCYYAKDKNNVYYAGYPISWDIQTFRCLSETTAKDNNFIYEKWEIKENVDATSFVYFNKYYAKDKNNVYVSFYYAEWWFTLPTADIETFQWLNEVYAKDKNNVYVQNNILPLADINTFEIIDQTHAKDKNYKYEWLDIVKCFNLSKDECKQKDHELDIILYEAIQE